jgi:hypothetical protein
MPPSREHARPASGSATSIVEPSRAIEAAPAAKSGESTRVHVSPESSLR